MGHRHRMGSFIKDMYLHTRTVSIGHELPLGSDR